jgi:hypothetical protein
MGYEPNTETTGKKKHLIGTLQYSGRIEVMMMEMNIKFCFCKSAIY